METEIPQDELNKKLRERFKELPKVVQSAITSADIQKQLRALADTNKLHLDQWQLLENEVMLTLLGFQLAEELAGNLKTDLDVSEEMSRTLAENISKIVFEPIREELERQLEHPDAKVADVSDIETARAQVLGGETRQVGPPVLPATPPPPLPTERAARAPVSEAYKSGEPSSSRKAIEDDPYREPAA